MKKQKIQIFILCLCGILCVGGYLFFRAHDFSQDAEETEFTVMDFASDEVDALQVSGETNLNFVREDGTWTETSLGDTPVDQDSVTALVSRFSHITTTQSAPGDAGNLSEYGLTEPAYTITVSLSDKNTITLYVGKENDLLAEYYLKREGDPGVYLVSEGIVSGLDKTPESFAVEETKETLEETAQD